MPNLLMRIVRRKSAFEPEQTIDEIIRLEFSREDGKPDLNLSVYDLEDAPDQVVQTAIEHYASAGLDPDRRGRKILWFDARGVSACPAPTAGSFEDTGWSNRDSCHRELGFEDKEGLIAFVAEVASSFDGLVSAVEKREFRDYVSERFRLRDPEWLALCTRDERWENVRKRLSESS